MARLYGDENFDHPVVEALRRLGHDVLMVREAGKGNQGIQDAEVLAFAVSHGRAILTFNRRHFIHLHRRSPSHCGIVICTRDANVAALAARIHQALVSCTDPDNQLIRINRPQTP